MIMILVAGPIAWIGYCVGCQAILKKFMPKKDKSYARALGRCLGDTSYKDIYWCS